MAAPGVLPLSLTPCGYKSQSIHKTFSQTIFPFNKQNFNWITHLLPPSWSTTSIKFTSDATGKRGRVFPQLTLFDHSALPLSTSVFSPLAKLTLPQPPLVSVSVVLVHLPRLLWPHCDPHVFYQRQIRETILQSVGLSNGGRESGKSEDPRRAVAWSFNAHVMRIPFSSLTAR